MGLSALPLGGWLVHAYKWYLALTAHQKDQLVGKKISATVQEQSSYRFMVMNLFPFFFPRNYEFLLFIIGLKIKVVGDGTSIPFSYGLHIKC